MRKWLLIFFSVCVFAILTWFLSEVFSGQLILPQAFSLGPLAVRYYGLIMALAVGAGFYIAIRRAPKYGIDPKKAEDLLFWLVIGGFIGARLYHALSSAPYYYLHPADIIKVWNGGLSIYGAVIGGFIVLLLYKRLSTKHLALSSLLDWLTPSLILGQIIGRFGNLFNYEAFGYPTNLPWKMFVKKSFRPIQFQNEIFFHPWFLYEALGNLIILFVLLKIIEPKYKKSLPGFLGFFYLLLYNALRFGLEFLRIDSTFIHNFRLNAVVSLGLCAIAAATLIWINKRNVKTP